MNPLPSKNSDDRNAAEDERRLRAIFREAEPPYLDDAGFTARVVGSLPASRAWRARRRLWLVATAVVLGGAIAGFLAGPELIEAAVHGWASLRRWSVHPVPFAESVLTFGSLAVLVAAAAVGWWSYSREQ